LSAVSIRPQYCRRAVVSGHTGCLHIASADICEN
jgi:hypothetical protein